MISGFVRMVWKTVVFSILFILISLFATSFSTASDKTEREEEISFWWAFGAITRSGGDESLQAVTRDATLRTGDRLQMLVKLENECYVYVFHESSRGELQMLFPFALGQFTNDYGPSRTYTIPGNDAWFELDQNTGYEKFHLLASVRRLTALEGLFREYESSATNGKVLFQQRILDEIYRLKKSKKLTTASERPEKMAGRLRGQRQLAPSGQPDLSTIAHRVTDTGLYVRTFTIEHR